MWDSLKKHRKLALVLLFILTGLVLLVLEQGQTSRSHLPPASATVQVAGASQALIARSGGGIGRFWDRHMNLVGVEQENARLRTELARIREEHTRLLGVMQENARLRAMVGFTEAQPHLELIPARVIARDINPWFRVLSLRLDTGTHRVQPHMPVVSSAGLVGQVSSVDGRYASVMLAVDKRSSIDIIVQRNRARGVLAGLGHDNDYLSEIQYLLRRDAARVGDLVVTSGMGGRFPQDLVVGTIAEVIEQSYGLFQEVRVEPAVDFSRLEEVYIIVGERGR